MIIGVHDGRPVAQVLARFPGASWGREFVAKAGGGYLPASTTTAKLISLVMAKVQPWLYAGGGCVVSVKLNPIGLGNGAYDAQLVALGRALAGLQVLVVLDHEPEDEFTAAVLASGFNRGRTQLKIGAPGLTVAYCAMSYQWRPGGKAAAYAAAWRAVDADLYLCDVYSGQTFPADATLATHPGFQRWHREIVAAVPGRRWGIAERGWTAGPTRAATIAAEAAWLATDPVGQTCSLYLVWNTSGTEANTAWLLDAAGEQAVADLLARVNLMAGYGPGPIAGTYVHQSTGVLVAADHITEFEAFLRRTTHA